MAIEGINHVTLQVRDFARAEVFYCDLLGLKRVGSREGMRFYSSGRYNHELALVQSADIPVTHTSMLHLAFNVVDQKRLDDFYQRAVDAGYAISAKIDHVISVSYYLQDSRWLYRRANY